MKNEGRRGVSPETARRQDRAFKVAGVVELLFIFFFIRKIADLSQPFTVVVSLVSSALILWATWKFISTQITDETASRWRK